MGEPLRLEYSKGWYGPYARNLDKVLQAMNGSYLVYQAQFNKPSTTINLVPDKRMEIENNLAILDAEQKQRLKTLKEFIYGFETAFSLELLATVDWIKNQRPELSYEEVHTEISQWTKRKADLIKLHHVKVAYNHLEKNKHLLIASGGYQPKPLHKIMLSKIYTETYDGLIFVKEISKPEYNLKK